MITPSDQTLLRRAIAIAARAITADSVRVALALGTAWHRAQNVQF